MEKTTYYTPKSIDEFDLKTLIEINMPSTIYSKVEGFVGYEDNWVQKLINSKILKDLERWYWERDLYGDIDLSRRVRIKVK